ncbi:MAG: hypothetical protein ABIG37_01080 [Nanoarchaeota archaeon]|nr:hypothetical protein [Nanoarchaeota archaeon]
MVSELVISIFAGCVGGLARGMHGALKSLSKGEEFKITHLLITTLLAGAIGAGLGSIFDNDYVIASLAGFTGTDILDNIFKGRLPTKITNK